MITLRPYQNDIIDRVRAEFPRQRRVLAVAPTGAGKGVILAYIGMNAAAKGNTVMIAVHRQEIVDQIGLSLNAMGVRHGRIQPGYTATDDTVQICMIQTVSRRLDRLKAPSMLIIDEAHHTVSATYMTILAAWPATKVLGFTATPQRADGKGLGTAFDVLVEGPTTKTLIDGGFLAPFRLYVPPSDLDLSGVKTKMGDYAVDQLAAAMQASTITGDAVSHYRSHLAGRPAIAFCITVAHAQEVAAQFRAAGYNAASVDGKMTKAERRDRIAAIGDGRLNVLASCELISEGVDVPVVAGAILLRPTQSLSVYLQQIGRCLRLKPDGSAAVVLDHVGNVHRHGAPDAPRVWTLDAKQRRAPATPVSTCGECYQVFSPAHGWKAAQACQRGAPAGCILKVSDATEPREIETLEGELVAFVAPPEINPAWTRGLSLKSAPLKEILRAAHADEQVREIGRARGFKAGWAFQICKMRADRRKPEPAWPRATVAA